MAQSFHFLDNPIAIPNGTSGVWQDISLSAYVAGLPNDVTGAILNVYGKYAASNANVPMLGWRAKGDTSVITGRSNGGRQQVIVGVDALYVFQTYNSYSTPTYAGNFFIVGYTTSGVVMHQTPISRGGGSASTWANLAALPAGAVGGIYRAVYTNNSNSMLVRATGSTFTLGNRAITGNGFFVTAASELGIVQGFRTSTAVTFYEVGYITDGVGLYINPVNVTQPTQTATLPALPPLSVGGFYLIYDYYHEGDQMFLRRLGSSLAAVEVLVGVLTGIVDCDQNGYVQSYSSYQDHVFYNLGFAVGAPPTTDYVFNTTAAFAEAISASRRSAITRKAALIAPMSTSASRTTNLVRKANPTTTISVIAFKTISYARKALVTIATAVTAGRQLVLARSTQAVISSVISALKGRGFAMVASAGTKVSLSASRGWSGIRTAATNLSAQVTASRILAVSRSTVVSTRITTTAGRLWGAARSTVALIDHKVSTNRIITIIRGATVTIYQKVTATTGSHVVYFFVAGIATEIEARASRVLSLARASTVVSSATVSAGRVYDAVREAVIHQAHVLTASRTWGIVRQTLCSLSQLVTGIKGGTRAKKRIIGRSDQLGHSGISQAQNLSGSSVAIVSER